MSDRVTPDNAAEPCPVCKGRGTLILAFGLKAAEYPCPTCQGRYPAKPKATRS